MKDFCCNKIRRCLWNQKFLSEHHVSMTPEKLKDHKYFGQENKFQGSLKLLTAQHQQKSVGLPVQTVRIELTLIPFSENDFF